MQLLLLMLLGSAETTRAIGMRTLIQYKKAGSRSAFFIVSSTNQIERMRLQKQLMSMKANP